MHKCFPFDGFRVQSITDRSNGIWLKIVNGFVLDLWRCGTCCHIDGDKAIPDGLLQNRRDKTVVLCNRLCSEFRAIVKNGKSLSEFHTNRIRDGLCGLYIDSITANCKRNRVNGHAGLLYNLSIFNLSFFEHSIKINFSDRFSAGLSRPGFR